ncbi:MAG: 4Fe-4S dicluster domain-containing protein, partial [Candidatus Heimdallarchaeota archaeon]
YEPLLRLRKRLLFVNLGRILVFLIILFSAAAGIVIYVFAIKQYEKWLLIRWCIFSVSVVILIMIDLAGTTPVIKSGLLEERTFSIAIEKEKCEGTGICIQVCPRNCYELNSKTNKIRMINAELCVRCGACIVQCPFDVLYFKNEKGQVISPDNVRKFKLNLMGKRDCCIACKISNQLIKA